MDDAEAQRQIQQMVNFILNEAKDKAQEIEAKALEDFNIEKLKLVQQMKDKIRQEYQKKAKSLEVKRAIQRSTAVNNARLRKMVARENIVGDVVGLCSNDMAEFCNDKSKYEKLMIDLTVQACLQLLEPQLVVQCREVDKALCERVLPQAADKFSEIVKKQAGVNRSVKLVLDTKFLPPPPSSGATGRTCAGGVLVQTTNRAITVDNTLDARLLHVTEECLPEIRKILFES